MKKLLLAGAVVLAAGIAAEAQNYSLVALSYDNTQLWYGDNQGYKKGLEAMGHESNSASLNGFGIQYSYGIGITDKPMNIEVGVKWNMGFNGVTQKEGDDGYSLEYKYRTQFMRLGIPVSYIYHIPVNDMFKIAPYAGIDFHFNLLAKTKITGTLSYMGESESSDQTYNWFKKDGDEGVGDNTFKRFQMGWHIGVRFEYKKLFLGVEYGTDFMPVMSTKVTYDDETYKSHINTGNLAINLGCYF